MPYYAVGDYNINLMRVNASNSVKNHVNYMINSSCKCVIDLPMRGISHSKTLLTIFTLVIIEGMFFQVGYYLRI